MKKNTLYLLEMGMNDNTLPGDIKNHRIRTVENIDIQYKGTVYNMFFEFTQGKHHRTRTTNKRTGEPPKKPVIETIIENGLFIDTQFEKTETDRTGRTWESSWRHSELEKEFWSEHHEYTKKDILEVVNKYKTGEPFTDICLIETTAREIIREKGGWREKDILGEGKNFQTEGSSYFCIGETWNADHKTVRCNKQTWTPTANGRKLVVTDFCEVDLITGNITL